MPLALTNGQKLGIAAFAVVFIVFAMLSSFVLPRNRPDYPGAKGLPAFILVTIALFVGMLTTMWLLAEEEDEGGDHGTEALVHHARR